MHSRIAAFGDFGLNTVIKKSELFIMWRCVNDRYIHENVGDLCPYSKVRKYRWPTNKSLCGVGIIIRYAKEVGTFDRCGCSEIKLRVGVTILAFFFLVLVVL